MANERVEEFLDLYKQLEQVLKNIYPDENGRYENVIARYENSRECGKRKDAVSAIREIRNVLQHNPKINGNYIITPSGDIMKALREIIDEVKHPKLAINFGVKADLIYKATLSSSLIKVINVMKAKGFSHVPVIDKDKLYGVLSPYAVFEFTTEQNMQIITENTKVWDMKAYLPIEKHKNEYYIFMPRTATFIDADEAFEKRDAKKRRLVAIFITEHGKRDEPLLAMLTPWSVVGK